MGDRTRRVRRKTSPWRTVIRKMLKAVSVLSIVFFLCCSLVAAVSAAHGEVHADSILFDITSQPLGAALETYAQISGREVLYDGRLAAGRRSSPVQGVYTAAIALQILLAGTGLQAVAKDESFFAIVRASRNSGPDRSAADYRYYGALQASLRATFCGSHALLDSSRVAARLWLDQNGAVLQVKLLGSTGHDEWDQRALAALSRLKAAEPPAGFVQPVTIVVSPRAADANDACAAQPQPPRTNRP